MRNKLRAISDGRPRLSVHRSSKNISVQVIDDVKGVAWPRPRRWKRTWALSGKNNVEAAAKIGSAIAERAKKAGVEAVIFDRGGFLFHGKIKALCRRGPRGRSEVLTIAGGAAL